MRTNKRPNILLVTCDQLRAVSTGCYGNSEVQTPHLDALANAGIRFEYGISNAPVCMAARSVLLSGQHNRRCTGGIANVSYAHGKIGAYPMPEYPAPGRLHFPDATLPELLQAAGYETAVIGKWHLYAWPDAIGFSRYLIPRTHHVHSAQHYVEDGGKEFVPEGWSVEFETRRAIQFLKQKNRERPFFLYLNYSPPHPPLHDCPEEYLRQYDPETLRLRDNVDESGGFPNPHQASVYRWDYRFYELQLPYTRAPSRFTVRDLYAAYYGNISWMDHNLGKVLEALERSGLREETIVVFTSDHGDNLGSHGRDGKGLPFDESLRVPMIYSWPSRWEPRTEPESIVGLVDVAPTLLRAANLEAPAHFAGSDVMQKKMDSQISEIGPGNMVVRTGRFTAHAELRGGVKRLAFFDNFADPAQLRNLSDTGECGGDQDFLFSLLEAHDRKTKTLPEPDYGFYFKGREKPLSPPKA